MKVRKTIISLQTSSSLISKKCRIANKNQWKVEEIPRWIIKKKKVF